MGETVAWRSWGFSMKPKTPIRSIREKCKDCCGGIIKEIRLCENQHCALWPYRMGCRPTSKRAVRPPGNVRTPKRADSPPKTAKDADS